MFDFILYICNIYEVFLNYSKRRESDVFSVAMVAPGIGDIFFCNNNLSQTGCWVTMKTVARE